MKNNMVEVNKQIRNNKVPRTEIYQKFKFKNLKNMKINKTDVKTALLVYTFHKVWISRASNG